MYKVLEIYKCIVLTIIALCLMVGTLHVKGNVDVDNPVNVKGKVDVDHVWNPVDTRGRVYVLNDMQHPISVQGIVDVDNILGAVDVGHVLDTVSVNGSVTVEKEPFGARQELDVNISSVGGHTVRRGELPVAVNQ